MHHVCSQIIMPETKDFEAKVKVKNKQITVDSRGTTTVNVPGLSYAMQQNFYSAGLLCEIFFSHAWDEPFFRSFLPHPEGLAKGLQWCIHMFVVQPTEH